MKPEASLYALIADDAEPTRTGETLLVDLDSEPAGLPLPAAPARPAGLAAAVQRSLAELRALAQAAAQGREAVAETVDYRDVPVIAAVRRVTPADWLLALQVDRREVLAEFERSGRLAGAAAAFLLLALAGFLVALHREQQRARLLQEQMRGERALSNLQGYADTIVASVPAGLLLLSADLHVLSANRAFLEAFRLTQEDVVGRDLQQLVRADRLVRTAGRALETRGAQPAAVYDLYVYARRETKPARVAMTAIHMADDAAPRLLLVIEDLTEEERLQAARQQSEQRYRDLIQGLDAIVWEADARTLAFSFVSRRAETVLGFPVERWLREPDFWAKRIHPEDRERALRGCREALAEGRDHEFEYRALAADGREVWLRDIVHVVQRRRRAARDSSRTHGGSDRAAPLGARAAPERGAAPPGPEDGRGGQARRRHRARLQQPAHGHPRRQRPHAAAPARRPPACARTRRASARPPTRPPPSPASSSPSAASRWWPRAWST